MEHEVKTLNSQRYETGKLLAEMKCGRPTESAE